LFYSPWKYGLLFQGPHGELALIIGYTQLVVLVASTLLLLAKKYPRSKHRYIIFWTTLTVLILFFMNPVSSLTWKYIPAFLWALLPTGRLALLISICTSIIAGYFVDTFLKTNSRKVLLTLLISITIGYTILNWGHRRLISEITDTQLRQNLPSSTAHGEGHFYANSVFRDPKHPWFSVLPKNHLEILYGSGAVKEIARTSTDHTYVVNAKSALSLRENTLYFPGWAVFDDRQNISINHDKEGVIMFTISKGLHYIELRYTDIFIFRLSKIVSIFGFLAAIVYLLFSSNILQKP
ncbi:MAG TPA: hypothetical protein VEP90_00210, partial [Methylomirabilota bacterium]|nr:hypothetical protein [Methylomirabilota bacterium]